MPAEPVRHQGGDVVDVGIVLALDAAGRGDNLDIKAARGLQAGNDGAYPLAAGDADRISVGDLFEHKPCRGFADRLERDLRVVGDRRHDDRAADTSERQQLFFDFHQWLDRRLDLDLDETKLAAALDEAVTVACEIPSWSAICACVMPSRKCSTRAWCICLAMTISSRGADMDFGLAFGMSESLPLVQQVIDGNRGEQYAALDHILPVHRNVEQDQRAGDDGEQGDAEDGAEDRARAAVQGGAADHRRGDDVEFHADAEGRRRGAEARHVDRPATPESVAHSTVTQNLTSFVLMPE